MRSWPRWQPEYELSYPAASYEAESKVVFPILTAERFAIIVTCVSTRTLGRSDGFSLPLSLDNYQREGLEAEHETTFLSVKTQRALMMLL
jgi:hypothetical protein